MSLIVEDGTGLAGAQSYVSVAEADVYHLARDNLAWAALTTSAKEIALRRATDYLGQVYNLSWDGKRTTETQALDWPRLGVLRRGISASPSYYSFNAIPQAVLIASFELALRSLTLTLLPDLERRTLRETVGPISVSYDPTSSALVKFLVIEGLLRPLLKSGGSHINLRRA